MSVKLVDEEIARFLGRADPEVLCIRLAQPCRLLCGESTRGELGMLGQRNLLAVVTLAAAAATTPAWGQTVVPSAGAAGRSTLSAVSVPDFSGVWAHPSGQSGFEPLPSGPRPVTGRLRRDGVSDPYQYVGDYTNPILKPEAAEVVKKHGEIEQSGLAHPTPSNHCWPSGVPYIFFQLGMQMLQHPDKITFLYLRDHEFRQVHMNRRHPAQVTPSWYGDSVGHYEGATLVIDTVGVKTDRPLAMLDMYGTPYTRALHVVERYRLLDYEAAREGLERDAKEFAVIPNTSMQRDPAYRGKYLQLLFTVEDQGVFTMPWSATITYGRPSGEWVEDVCAEGTENTHYAPREEAVFPTANKPDF
jgi:hypothetical protein